MFKDNTSPLALGLFIATGSMLAYFIFVGHPMWGTNDDVAISMIAAGVWHSSQPSSDLFFLHPFYGWFISHLYIWQPDVPWYGISFILIVGLSLVILNYSILRLRRQLHFSLIVIYATIDTVLPSLWHLQFTIVAGLATVAGIMLLLSFFKCKPTTEKSFIVGILTSLCLLVTGAMIRFDAMLMVGVLCAPFITFLILKSALSTQSGKNRRSYIIRFVIVGMIIGVSLIGLQEHKQRYYNNSTEWTKWFSLNEAKGQFIDYQRIQYNEQTRNIFDTVGWSQTDYNMIMSWQYVDPIQYAPDKFLYVVDHLQKGPIEKIMQISDFERWRSSLTQIINGIKSLMSKRCGLLFCICIVGLLTTRWEKWNLLYMCSIICAIIAVYFYLYFIVIRTPFRVIVLIWICVLWMMLLISTNSMKCSTPQVGRWKSYIAVARVILVLLMLVSMYRECGYARDLVKRRIVDQNNLENRVNAWSTNLPPNSIIYCIGNSFPYEHHLPLKSFAYLRTIEAFIQTGWVNQSPLQRQIITDLGLDDDFYESLAQKENVYMVKRKEDFKPELSALRNYYVENYGLELSLVEEPNLPYLYRMVFTNVR